MLSEQMRDRVTLVKSDGTRVENVVASVQRSLIFIADGSLPLEEDDILERRLANGLVERFRVLDRGFYDATHGFPSHYQARVERQDAPAPEVDPPAEVRPLNAKPIVFLSHSAEDVLLAEYLDQTVRQVLPHHDVFRTSRPGQIPTGRPWFNHVIEHLRAAERYIVLLTPASQARSWISFETGVAFMTGRTLIPVLAGGLVAKDVIEPLRNLQLISLDEPEQAALFARELGGTLPNPSAFAQEVSRIGTRSRAVGANSSPTQTAPKTRILLDHRNEPVSVVSVGKSLGRPGRIDSDYREEPEDVRIDTADDHCVTFFLVGPGRYVTEPLENVRISRDDAMQRLLVIVREPVG